MTVVLYNTQVFLKNNYKYLHLERVGYKELTEECLEREFC